MGRLSATQTSDPTTPSDRPSESPSDSAEYVRFAFACKDAIVEQHRALRTDVSEVGGFSSHFVAGIASEFIAVRLQHSA